MILFFFFWKDLWKKIFEGEISFNTYYYFPLSLNIAKVIFKRYNSSRWELSGRSAGLNRIIVSSLAARLYYDFTLLYILMPAPILDYRDLWPTVGRGRLGKWAEPAVSIVGVIWLLLICGDHQQSYDSSTDHDAESKQLLNCVPCSAGSTAYRLGFGSTDEQC